MILVAAAASAQEKKGGLPFPGGDSKAPVEITSDTLDVQQESSQAIFRGNVLAAQGNTRLRADEMVVHYRQKQSAAPSGGDNPLGAISRIDVRGKVTLATATENASADRGAYMVDQQKILLEGNVVLTKGKNVIRGNQLTYDLTTSRSVISGGVAASNGKGRVRALFEPEQKGGQ